MLIKDSQNRGQVRVPLIRQTHSLSDNSRKDFLKPSLSRRQLLAWLGTTAMSQIARKARAQYSGNFLRVGVILPTRTGSTPRNFLSSEIVGELAYLGATLAAEDLGGQDANKGQILDVHITSAPTPEVAVRAAARLLAVEQVSALVGGFSPEECQALSLLAHQRRVPFFNIGCASDRLREISCNSYTFHIEASAAMYLDALVDWFTQFGVRQWFFVYSGSKDGRALYERSLIAMGRHPETTVGGQVVVPQEEQAFLQVLEAIRRAQPEGVLLLLDAATQLSFLGVYEDAGLDIPIIGFPDSVSQTRVFFNSLRNVAPRTGTGCRVVLWEATLEAYGASALNQRFASRFGQPLEPSAWAAYQAINLLYQAATIVGTEGHKLVSYFESPHNHFEVGKGPGISFRPWDHQLRQPVYLVKLNPKAGIGIQLSQKLALAQLVGQVPDIPAGTDPVPLLDQLGNLVQDSPCQR